ncbi:MAG: ketosteroid isomerase-related protein [Fimbriimonas sp.]
MITEELIQRYFDAFNRHDAEGLLATLSDDVIHDINEGPTEVGIEAFLKFKAHMDQCYREQITDLVIMTNGEHGAAKFTCSGEYLATDGNLPPATGQTYAIQAAAIFEVKDGKIQRVTSYYNLAEWLKAIA